MIKPQFYFYIHHLFLLLLIKSQCPRLVPIRVPSSFNARKYHISHTILLQEHGSTKDSSHSKDSSSSNILSSTTAIGNEE